MSDPEIRPILARYHRLLGRDRVADVEDELAFHLEMRVREFVERGMDPAEAREAAMRRFGDVRSTREECLAIGRRRERRLRRVRSFTGLGQDLRHALRRLGRAPTVPALAVLTLSIGIGAATALFGTVDRLLLRPLPLHEPERLVRLSLTGADGSLFIGLSEERLREMRGATDAFSGVAGAADHPFTFRESGQAELLQGQLVSPGYFDVLGVRAEVGRFFAAGEEDGSEPAAVAVVSHRVWRQRLGADPEIRGRSIRLNGHPFSVVGVAPHGFTTARIGAESPEVWVPLAAHDLLARDAGEPAGERPAVWPVARLRDGISADAARERLNALSGRWREEGVLTPPLDRLSVRPLDPVSGFGPETVAGFVRLLALATGLLLLVTAMSVAGMLLARSAVRQREIGIRMAMGAERMRVARHLAVEGLVLFLAGGAGGVLVAYGLGELVARVPWPVPVELEATVDGRVLAFSLLLSLVTGVGFSLLPALHGTRGELLPALREGGVPSGPRPAAVRSALVVAQVALSVVLLTSAALFARALQRAWSIDPGFDPDGVLVAAPELRVHGYPPQAALDFGRRLLERASALPEVESAALAAHAPFLSRGEMRMSLLPPGAGAPAGAGNVLVPFETVSTGYFGTLRIRLLAGRAFTPAEEADGAPVVVVSRALAERYWPGESPVGRRIGDGYAAWEVVGMVENTASHSLESARPEELERLYLPLGQQPVPGVTLHVRARGSTVPAASGLREIARSLDPSLPPLEVLPLSRLIGLSLLPQRLGAWVVGAFGLFGLLLAALGLYGLLYHTVVQRTREIGIRMALGAHPLELVRQVVGRGTRLAAVGALLGIAGAAAATRLIAGLIYGVSALDPLAFGAAVLLLLGVALLASLIPARRAAKVDPMRVLRAE